MPLASFTSYANPGPGGNRDGSYQYVYAITPGGVHYYNAVAIYGPGTQTTNWGLGTVIANDSNYTFTQTKWNELRNTINAERARRVQPAVTMGSSSPMNASDYNDAINALNVAGNYSADQAYNTDGTTTITTYPVVGAPTVPGAVNHNDIITAAAINALVNAINAAGQACICNCNYCTCNCNYCTCNCNYACTCNCNYGG